MSRLFRSDAYTIIEISLFAGRDATTKRRLLERLMTTIADKVETSARDIEITLFETPKANWGIRGQVADELKLDYKVDV